MVSKQIYIQSDGNGGMNISKLLLSIITLLPLLTSFGIVIWTSATVRADLDSAQTALDELKMHVIEDEREFLELERQNVEYRSDIKYLKEKVDRIEEKVDRLINQR